MNPVMQTLRPALSVFALLTALTGVAYPLLVTGIAQAAFPHAANGSLLSVDGKAVGSALIGQSFSAPKYFWGRPSATSPMPNNGVASGGSNLGANNPALLDAVARPRRRVAQRRPRQRAAGAGRSGHRLGQRPRPRDQPGRGAVPGARGSRARAASMKRRFAR